MGENIWILICLLVGIVFGFFLPIFRELLWQLFDWLDNQL